MPSSELCLHNGRVLTPEGIRHADVLVADGHVVSIVQPGSTTTQRAIDCRDRVVAPGLIDLQVNGGGGHMFSDGGAANAHRIVAAHARTGTTALLATVITGHLDEMCDAIHDVVRAARDPRPDEAEIVGVHVEGPFLNRAKRGAHAEQLLRQPSVEDARRLVDAADGMLRCVTLAPELDGADETIRYLRGEGVVVSIGHTDARASDIVAAADAGAGAVTHLFNAMRGLDSREPGTVGAALLDDRLQLGMIADGKHVSPTTMQIALRAKGHNGMFLVSDAVSPTGTTQTSFTLYGIDVEVRDGGCYTPEGVLAGSATPLHGGVAVLCRDAQQPVERAIAMATRHPARVIGLEGCKGGLFEGAHADIVVLDEALRPTDVIVRGEPLATLAPLA